MCCAGGSPLRDGPWPLEGCKAIVVDEVIIHVFGSHVDAMRAFGAVVERGLPDRAVVDCCVDCCVEGVFWAVRSVAPHTDKGSV